MSSRVMCILYRFGLSCLLEDLNYSCKLKHFEERSPIGGSDQQDTVSDTVSK